ncbi:hypothetical protein MATR_12110 [Marivirga tractuosa]|uniref:PorV/PorQ family protein n=1 Tax=Marivirga tractuosa (strain ATCC 23168 / DSM 4126 / NBRC 15989 / NCIMB 1408 / VKM B-1430 / H-43) TaxID=643867 RepID=E4TVP7_MARTH|nr:hypothetical protein [Marivirga tractuosa]ADR21160.1 hypothetical protein Ftrac_1165 [Marivirga tractuosa DSM 4126]BDD14386.1 hypothetical protein MATR_12110 [Marivirga tractuosa]
MKLFNQILPILLLFAFQINAQSIYSPVSSRVIGLGDAAVTMDGYWASFQNTAGITNTESFEVGATYENRFGMLGMDLMAAGLTAKLPFGYASLSVFRFGDEIYNEHKIALGYATKLGIIKLGGRLNYLQYQVQDFGTQETLSIDFGGIASITPQLLVGAQALNITQSSLNVEAEHGVPTLLKLGVSYRPRNYFMLNAEIEKDIVRPALLKLGAEYNFLEKFYLRTGVNSGSFQSFYGLGFKCLSIQWDYALSNHAEMGFSHSISMQYRIKNR